MANKILNVELNEPKNNQQTIEVIKADMIKVNVNS